MKKILIVLFLIFIIILAVITLLNKPITIRNYFIQHNISNITFTTNSNDGSKLIKKLSKNELDDFIIKFGLRKIYKPLFRKKLLDNTNYNNYIAIRINDDKKNLNIDIILTERGDILLDDKYIFYPYNFHHKDIYDFFIKYKPN